MSFLLKGALFYLMLAIALSFAVPNVVFGTGTNPTADTLLSWFNIHRDIATNDISVSQGLSGSGVAANPWGNMSSQPTIPTGTTWYRGIDPLLQVWSWISTIGAMFMSPIILLTKPELTGIPIAILLIIAVPVVLLFIISLIGWIRSGEL